MLLRRLALHVKTQNSFAVWLDFLIVVVGVFIGFQVTAWNEQRSDRALEADYSYRSVRVPKVDTRTGWR